MKKVLGALVCVCVCAPSFAQAQEFKVVPVKPVVKGSLDKEIIRRVIRKHRSEVRHCYEKQLAKDPELAGKVTVEFVISKDGSVSSASVASSTVENVEVGSCVAEKVARWKFPEPKGGGIVVVKYPFVFKASEPVKKGITIEQKKTAAIGSLSSDGAVHGFGGIGLAGPLRGEEESEGGAAKVSGRVVPGKAMVRGSLDKEIIRRVVRQHRNEVRYCYEKQLQKDPELHGKVSIKFVINETGSVMSATVADSTLKDDEVGACVVRKVRRWVFPELKGGGVVLVTYPFVFATK